jgi:competence protein ComEA
MDEQRPMEEHRPAWYGVPAADRPASGSPLFDRFREHPAAALVLGLVVALGIALGGVWVAASAPSPQVELDPIAAGSGDATPEDGALVVDVAGAVRSPGLYRLPAGARVGDAISAAGGFGPAVDTIAASAVLNLAAALSDGQKIVVPARGAATAPPSGGSGGSPGSTLVDVNHASQAELEALPGIGPATAQKIIAARSERAFASAHELLDRKLVGNATWEKIRDLVTAG